MAACPEPSSLDAFALGSAAGPERTRIEQHIDGCPTCSGVVAELMRIYGASAVAHDGEELAYQKTLAAPHTTAPSPAVGQTIGRYRVIGRLGEGGMGAVLAAHDPELDRTVALKILHESAGDERGELRDRLAREARAMAKLAHPNVVAVYDVGADPASGQLFVTMELVDGTTLRDWLRTPRSSRAILDVFMAAGTGLAAAHAAGLVHRDFKPENVLVGRDGRVRVGDFGLARPPRGAAASDAPLSPTLTRTGAIIGTPAYMAPEQFLGEAADARSDQFAFAVALFEALRGERPFAGASLRELSENVVAGRLSPSVASGPRWQRRFFARALARDRMQRYPSMSAVLDVLAREPGRGRRLAAWGAGAAGSAAVISIALFLGVTNADRSKGASEPQEAEGTPSGIAPPAASIRAEVERLRGELASADDTLRTWVPNLDPTKSKITKVVERARALGYEPLLAEALLRLGRVERKLERPKRAQAALEEAVTVARGSRHDALLYDAIIDLVEVVGVEQGLSREADTWIGLAVAESKRQPEDARRLARLELATARTRVRAKAFDQALAHFDRALEISEKSFGERSREAAEALRDRAFAKRAKGDPMAGLADAKRAADIAGDDPILKGGMDRGLYRLALGELLLATGDGAGATTELEHADEALAQFGRASSAQLAVADALARAYRSRSETEKARAAADKALSGFLEETDEKLRFHDPTGSPRSSGAIDIAQRIKGGVEKPEDASAISDANAKAATLATEGDEAGALRELEDVLVRAVENPALVAGSQGAIRYNLALLSLRKGDLASASSQVGESLSALAREVGDEHLRYGVAMSLEARILERQGSPKAPARAEAAQKLIVLRR